MAAKNPTNTDIMVSLSELKMDSDLRHKENDKRLIAIETQVKYTNGRVKAMETKWERAEAVEEYKSSHPTPNVKVETNIQGVDWQKILLAALGLIGTALAIVGVVVGAK